jgi:hypothetical protein
VGCSDILQTEIYNIISRKAFFNTTKTKGVEPMKLKGDYKAATTYDVGDVVRFEKVVYHLQHPCPAGTPPKDTRYWAKTSQPVADIVNIALDAVDMANSDDVPVPDNIGPSSIVLNSSTDGSSKQFLLTIADPATGEDPELTITEIVPDTPAAEESET